MAALCRLPTQTGSRASLYLVQKHALRGAWQSPHLAPHGEGGRLSPLAGVSDERRCAVGRSVPVLRQRRDGGNDAREPPARGKRRVSGDGRRGSSAVRWTAQAG